VPPVATATAAAGTWTSSPTHFARSLEAGPARVRPRRFPAGRGSSLVRPTLAGALGVPVRTRVPEWIRGIFEDACRARDANGSIRGIRRGLRRRTSRSGHTESRVIRPRRPGSHAAKIGIDRGLIHRDGAAGRGGPVSQEGSSTPSAPLRLIGVGRDRGRRPEPGPRGQPGEGHLAAAYPSTIQATWTWAVLLAVR